MKHVILLCSAVAISCQSAPAPSPGPIGDKELEMSQPWIPPVPDGQQPLDVQWVRSIGRPFTGAAAPDALVTIVGFGDFACPDTRRGEHVVAGLLEEHPEVRYTYVDHNVIDHPFGAVARRVAAIALKQFPPTVYWDVHETMFGEQFRKLEPGDESEALEKLGLGPYREFEAEENALGRHLINHGEANALGVSWAPTYFVNGVPIVDADPGHFEKLVTTQLDLARRVSAASDLAGEPLYRELAKRNGADVPPADQAGAWHIIGFEVVGYDETPREKIVAAAPMELGAPLEGPPERDACSRAEEELGLAALDCSLLQYADFTAYVTMHVVETGDEARLKFRQEPDGRGAEIPAEIAEVYQKLNTVHQRRFQTGQPPRENGDAGFLDYDDPEMHELVLKLNELVPPHRELLYDVLEDHADLQQRGTAATLLNWAGAPRESIARVHGLLDDPSAFVRNNISRFMLHYIDGLQNAKTRRAVAKSLLVQMRRSTMVDQNKALYGLLALAKTSNSDRDFILAEGGSWLRKLAEQSVLTNVGGVAHQLLAMQDER